MPVIDLAEGRDLDAVIERAVAERSFGAAVRSWRAVFVERLDFARSSGVVPLPAARAGAAEGGAMRAERIAEREGVQVVGVALDDGRITAQKIRAALRRVGAALAGDLLLAVTVEDGVGAAAGCAEWHLVWPTSLGGREVLRRMILRRGEPRRTPVGQLAGMYQALARGADLRAALERAYDVKAVTKEFFKKYREVFEAVEASISGFGDAARKRLFTQRLFNRLLFVAFVEKKGWLTFEGDPDYLNALWKDYQRRKDGDSNFYRERLDWLFFAGLNTSHEQDVINNNGPNVLQQLIGKVPYLNGGLFEKDEDDNREEVRVPDEAIESILTELFGKFNFTVTESTPWDVVVAVDPEMLGKVFEELVTGRHETGSYYTPKEIVSFMCREALKGYLETATPGETAAAIARFVDNGEPDDLRDREAVLKALQEVTVCDPACGSGAYLLGMLHELFELRDALFRAQHLDAITAYKRKLEIIATNIYGVDIDEFAVNIARLRLWLSLVVEYDGPEPEPLPNLTFKIEQGDSLTPPDPSGGASIGLATGALEDYFAAKRKYLTAHSEEKRALATR